jgi:hypothetical protein
LKGKRFGDMETVEHPVMEQLLVITEVSLRGAVSTDWNGGTNVNVVNEPTLKGFNLPSLEEQYLNFFTDLVSVLSEQALCHYIMAVW